MMKNPTYHSNTKHIDVQYHFVRDIIEYMKVLLVKVDILRNFLYSLQKYLSTKNFSFYRKTITHIATIC